jgi:DNA invertase Pin-like site-specific DNA recombinase
MKRMKRAVLYARVSTDAQQKEGTIESQVLELKRQIAAAGDVLVSQRPPKEFGRDLSHWCA